MRIKKIPGRKRTVGNCEGFSVSSNPTIRKNLRQYVPVGTDMQMYKIKRRMQRWLIASVLWRETAGCVVKYIVYEIDMMRSECNMIRCPTADCIESRPKDTLRFSETSFIRPYVASLFRTVAGGACTKAYKSARCEETGRTDRVNGHGMKHCGAWHPVGEPLRSEPPCRIRAMPPGGGSVFLPPESHPVCGAE